MALHLSYHCLIALRVPHIKNLSSLFLTYGRSQPAQLAQLYPAPLLSRQAKVNMKDPSDSCFHLCCLTYFRTLVPRSLSGGLLYHTGRVSHLGFPRPLCYSSEHTQPHLRSTEGIIQKEPSSDPSPRLQWWHSKPQNQLGVWLDPIHYSSVPPGSASLPVFTAIYVPYLPVTTSVLSVQVP